MGRFSSTTIVTIIGLIATTVVVLTCFNVYGKNEVPAYPYSPTDPEIIESLEHRITEVFKPKRTYETNSESESELHTEKDKTKSVKNKEISQKDEKEIFAEEISDENTSTKKEAETNSNLRKEIQKDLMRKEDRKLCKIDHFYAIIFSFVLYQLLD
jgi:hypothetical protein